MMNKRINLSGFISLFIIVVFSMSTLVYGASITTATKKVAAKKVAAAAKIAAATKANEAKIAAAKLAATKKAAADVLAYNKKQAAEEARIKAAAVAARAKEIADAKKNGTTPPAVIVLDPGAGDPFYGAVDLPDGSKDDNGNLLPKHSVKLRDGRYMQRLANGTIAETRDLDGSAYKNDIDIAGNIDELDGTPANFKFPIGPKTYASKFTPAEFLKTVQWFRIGKFSIGKKVNVKFYVDKVMLFSNSKTGQKLIELRGMVNGVNLQAAPTQVMFESSYSDNFDTMLFDKNTLAKFSMQPVVKQNSGDWGVITYFFITDKSFMPYTNPPASMRKRGMSVDMPVYTIVGEDTFLYLPESATKK